MKILVTGCNGQLGREMQAVLERHHPATTLYTDIDTLDLCDAEGVDRFIVDNGITHVINCAAYTAVDRAETDSFNCARANVDAVTNLARAAARHGVKIIHISTDYVFDGKSYIPYKEESSVNPQSIYGVTKRKGESVLLSLCPDAVIIRTAWLYSAFGSSNFVRTMLRLGREKCEIGVVYDQVGSPTNAADLAVAILAVLDAKTWMPGVYHFTNEGVCSWYDFAKAIHRIAGIKDCKVRPILTAEYPTAAVRPPYSVLDKNKIKLTFGLDIPHWEESLHRCLEIIKKEEK